MNIYEMHNTFRTLGQQMGLQLNRGILPESIDVYLNDSIIEIVRQELGMSTQIANQQSGTFQASSMSAVNAFRTLFRNKRFAFYNENDNEDVDVCENDNFNSELDITYNCRNGYYALHIPEDKDIMMFLAFSLEYDKKSEGFATHCRVVSPDVIEMTLNDYCNKASKEYPIICINSTLSIDNVISTDLNIYTATKGLKVEYLNIKYIKTPNIVKLSPNESECVNCDLPEHLHNLVVENAVRKYFISMSGYYNQGSKDNNS